MVLSTAYTRGGLQALLAMTTNGRDDALTLFVHQLVAVGGKRRQEHFNLS
jgi:hypothetical protein